MPHSLRGKSHLAPGRTAARRCVCGAMERGERLWSEPGGELTLPEAPGSERKVEALGNPAFAFHALRSCGML